MKRFLSENKIYFETIGSLLPVTLAVVFSVISLWQSGRAIQISTEQTRLVEHMASPYFTADARPVLNDSMSVIASSVEITNRGESIRYPKMEVYEFLSVECGLVGKGVWTETIPIRGYYLITYLTGETVGVIGKLLPGDNYRKMGDLYFASLESGKAQDSGYIAPFFSSIIRLQYETKSGNHEVIYLSASPHGTGVTVEDTYAEKLIAKRKMEDPFSILEFDRITPEAIRQECGLSGPSK